MFPVIRAFFLVFGVAALSANFSFPLHAEDAAAPDQAAVAAIKAAQTGDWNQAYGNAAQSRDPLVHKVVRWLDYSRSNPSGRFAEIVSFIEQNPDWPLQKTLRRRAEDALAGESDDTAADWLKRNPPVSATGKARAAELLYKRDPAAGAASLRTAWVDGDFSPTDEHSFATRFASVLRIEDNVKRLDRLIWDSQTDAARRMLTAVPAETRSLAEARLGLAASASNAEALLAKVPAQLRDDPGLAFEEARWRRKKDQTDPAAQLLLAHPDNPVRPEVWWGERALVARRLLAIGGGNAQTAYKVVQQHGLSDGNSYSEAEFLAGYIALRYTKDPNLAFDHFAHILARVSTPYGKARAAYWAGRAAEAAGNPDLAKIWYAAGSDHMTTFYGQLAAHQLGNDAPPRPTPEAKPDAADLALFNGRDMVRAARWFFAAGDRDHARTLLLQMTESAKAPAEFTMLAGVAEQYGRIDVAIGIARRSIDAGLPLMVHGYPVTALPSGGTAERSLLFAIMRQESGFATDAMSRVGARGLMQLMPATAAGVAAKLQLPFTPDRLTSDGVYNVLLGRSYLEKLIDDFGGSYALAIASYNAGPGRVRQWLRDYGDPRGRDLDMVDWIEAIPFNETRIYVQRVLENLQIYRGQDKDNNAAFSLVSDLAR